MPVPLSSQQKSDVIRAVESFVQHEMQGAEPGHDWPHIARVRSLALRIAHAEQAEAFVVELGALLHDIADEKLYNDPPAQLEKTQKLLEELGVDAETSAHVGQLIANVSFKGGANYQTFDSLPLRIVQDADRLEAIGAIGIARMFSYGAIRHRPFYEPDVSPSLTMSPEEYRKNKGTTFNHFYEKLLLLKDRMNTETARQIAEKRHAFMQAFIEQFLVEWNAEDASI